MILGAEHKSPDIYLTAEENPRKSQGTVDEGCVASHRPKWGPLPPNEVHIAQHIRKGDRRTEQKDGVRKGEKIMFPDPKYLNMGYLTDSLQLTTHYKLDIFNYVQKH